MRSTVEKYMRENSGMREKSRYLYLRWIPIEANFYWEFMTAEIAWTKAIHAQSPERKGWDFDQLKNQNYV